MIYYIIGLLAVLLCACSSGKVSGEYTNGVIEGTVESITFDGDSVIFKQYDAVRNGRGKVTTAKVFELSGTVNQKDKTIALDTGENMMHFKYKLKSGDVLELTEYTPEDNTVGLTTEFKKK